MANNKVTKKEMFNAIKDVLANVEVEGAITKDMMVEALSHEVELLEKKALNKKATKNQEENVGIKAEILNTLSEVGITVTELMEKSEVLGGYQNQKITALLKQLKDEGKVVKTYDKKKAYFSLPVEEPSEEVDA